MSSHSSDVPDPTARFSARVDAYVKYRPGYPAVVMDLFAREVGPGAVVADVGSGTGISAEPFLRAGHEVFCVEPNAEMRGAAAERLLGPSFPRFHSVAGSAEATSLPDASVDLLLCAQAFHWFDRARARREFARIGRRGAQVALVWNARRKTGSAFLEGYEGLLMRYGTDYSRVDHESIGGDELREFLGPRMRRATFPNEQRFDAAGLRGRVASSSYTPMPGQAGYAELFAGLDELFASTAGAGGRVVFEYVTEVYWAPL